MLSGTGIELKSLFLARFPAALTLLTRNPFGFLLTDQTSKPRSEEQLATAGRQSCLSAEAVQVLLHPHKLTAARFQSPGSGGMSDLTEVEVLWLEKRIENRDSVRSYRQRNASSIVTGVSCHLRPAASLPSSDGPPTTLGRSFRGSTSCAQSLRDSAARPSLYVTPGGEILLRLSGWPKVERVLQMIDAVEALGIDPADVAPDHWHHVHNRLSVNENPRLYTKARHQAWLHRQKVMR